MFDLLGLRFLWVFLTVSLKIYLFCLCFVYFFLFMFVMFFRLVVLSIYLCVGWVVVIVRCWGCAGGRCRDPVFRFMVSIGGGVIYCVNIVYDDTT